MKFSGYYNYIFLIFASVSLAVGQKSTDINQNQYSQEELMEHLTGRLRFSGGTAEEYLKVARFQIGLGNIDGFKTARFLLENAILKYGENIELILFFANMLYEHGFESEAIGQYETAIEIDKECWPAWYRLGAVYRQKMTRFRHEITSKGWSFQDYAAENFNLADEAFKKCLEHNYGGDSLIVNLFWLYFDSNNLIPAATVLNSYFKYQIYNAELYELAGLVNVRIRDFKEAEICYKRAFKLMSDHQKDPYFISKNYLNARTQYLTTDQNISLEDPLLITEYNERELEHFARVSYAQKKFSVKFKGTEGWQSDQGKIIIRYGFPADQVVVRGELENELIDEAWRPGWNYLERQKYSDFGYWQKRNATIDEGGGRIRDTKKPIYWDFMTWYYPDFQISFDDEFNNGDFQFAEKDEFASRSISRAEKSHTFFADNLFNTKPEIYALETRGGEVKVIQEFISNQLLKNKIQINFNYYFEPGEMGQIHSPWKFALFRSRAEADKFRKFSQWESKVDNGDFWLKDTTLLGQKQFEAYAGIYKWIFEGFREESQEFFRYEFSDTIADLNPRRLAMGEIQLGFYDPVGSSYLASLPEIPNASHSFHHSERMVISFDMDGLDTLDRENELEIQYTIIPRDEPQSIWKTLGSIFVADEEVELGLSVTNNYPVTEKYHRVKQILDIKNLAASEYLLEVDVLESSSNSKLQRYIHFYVK